MMRHGMLTYRAGMCTAFVAARLFANVWPFTSVDKHYASCDQMSLKISVCTVFRALNQSRDTTPL